MKDNSKTASQLTEMTLAEQLKITDRDIAERKEMVGFYQSDEKVLKECKDYIQEHLDPIVDEFYRYQRSIQEIQLLIGDAETFRRLHSSMKRYVLELFEGYYDNDYVNRRLRIGKVHKSIGVSPKLYISSLARLESILYRYLVEADNGENPELVIERTGALRKLLMLDIQFVFDTYINSLMSEVLTAKRQVETYAETLEETINQRTRQLEELSRTDSLTGLNNQRTFYESLRHELAVAERNKTVVTLVYFDLNAFKELNDRLGHRSGDDVLTLVGKTLMDTSRLTDICCRYGGDEFCVIMPNTQWQETRRFCERLIRNFDQGETLGVTFSIGVAETGPEKFLTLDDLVNLADDAMYKAKEVACESNGHEIFHAKNLSAKE